MTSPSTSLPDNAIVGNFTPRQVRIQGGMLLVLGTALVVGISAALMGVGPFASNRLVVAMLSWALLLSVLFVVVGVQQLMTGRRMKALLYPGFAMVVITLVGIWFLRDMI